MNAYPKEIAEVCGIQKTLTYYIARHTFATTVTLTNGVPIETVSKMLVTVLKFCTKSFIHITVLGLQHTITGRREKAKYT